MTETRTDLEVFKVRLDGLEKRMDEYHQQQIIHDQAIDELKEKISRIEAVVEETKKSIENIQKFLYWILGIVIVQLFAILRGFIK